MTEKHRFGEKGDSATGAKLLWLISFSVAFGGLAFSLVLLVLAVFRRDFYQLVFFAVGVGGLFFSALFLGALAYIRQRVAPRDNADAPML